MYMHQEGRGGGGERNTHSQMSIHHPTSPFSSILAIIKTSRKPLSNEYNVLGVPCRTDYSKHLKLKPVAWTRLEQARLYGAKHSQSSILGPDCSKVKGVELLAAPCAANAQLWMKEEGILANTSGRMVLWTNFGSGLPCDDVGPTTLTLQDALDCKREDSSSRVWSFVFSSHV